mgnify:FL=1
MLFLPTFSLEYDHNLSVQLTKISAIHTIKLVLKNVQQTIFLKLLNVESALKN